MKKLLYLIPFILIGLSALPISLYKDKVDFLLSKNPNAKVEDLSGALTKLSPGHWKMLDYQVDTSANLSSFSYSLDSTGPEAATEQQAAETSKPDPLYKGATFHGFPFGAYFSKNSSTNTANAQSSYSASGYSWVWAVIDVLLIIVSMVVSFKLNRKKKTNPLATQQISNQYAAPMNPPQATVVEPTTVVPTPLIKTQAPQTIQPSQQPSPHENNQNQ